MICSIIEECKQDLSKPRDTFIDRKGCRSKYIVDNKGRKRYFKIDFENDVYGDRENDTKCDYGLEIGLTIFYVELKGSDVNKGVNQLLSTLKETEKCFQGHTKKARLVVSKFPKPNLTKKRKEYKDLVRSTGNNVTIIQNTFTEII